MKVFVISLLLVLTVNNDQPFIKGTVYEGENCLGKVKIYLQSNEQTYHFKSDKKGNFELSGIKEGMYKIGFEKKGYVGYTVDNFKITQNYKLQLKVQLVKVRGVHEGGMKKPPNMVIDTLSHN